MTFKVNDKVRIKKDRDSESYFGIKYIGTTAAIKAVYGHETVSVICFDGKEYVSHVNFLEKLSKEVIKNEISCKHENKYKNRISARIMFWVCPDCGKDLGDA